MRIVGAVVLAASYGFLAACGLMPNSGAGGSAIVGVNTSGDTGVYKDTDYQSIVDGAPAPFEAVFRSIHPGGRADGIGTTEWTYVRGVEFPLSQLSEIARGGFSDAVLKFFIEPDCAPTLSTEGEDLIRSGIIVGGESARLVLTRVQWSTELGPKRANARTVRIHNTRLAVFGASIPVQTNASLTIDLSLTFERESASSGRDYTFEKTATGLRTDAVSVSCDAQTLSVPEVPLGSSGWFNREGVFNLIVSVHEL